MSVVVNVMLSIMSIISPPPALCNQSVRTAVKLCILGVLAFGVILVSGIVMMCVVNKQFQLLEYVRDVLYAVLYVRVSCFVVRGCGVSRRYIDVCYCVMFSVVNVYLGHLTICVVYINRRRYVCCSECNVVSNECNEPTSSLVQHIGAHCCEVMYFGCFGFRGELGFLNCDDVCRE